MRILALVLGALLLAIQIPLWFGKGGWLRVAEFERQLDTQRATNEKLSARNAEVAAEVTSLRDGREAIEERARRDLNMVREGEVFFQVVAPKPDPATAAVPTK